MLTQLKVSHLNFSFRYYIFYGGNSYLPRKSVFTFSNTISRSIRKLIKFHTHIYNLKSTPKNRFMCIVMLGVYYGYWIWMRLYQFSFIVSSDIITRFYLLFMLVIFVVLLLDSRIAHHSPYTRNAFFLWHDCLSDDVFTRQINFTGFYGNNNNAVVCVFISHSYSVHIENL